MELLESGPERPPRPPAPRGALALALAALAVAAAGVLAVPRVAAEQDAVRDAVPAAAPSPGAPVVTAMTSGSSEAGGSLRLWLLLQGPASSALSGVRVWLPASLVEVGPVPAAFSARGFAALQLDIDPDCPSAVRALGRAHLHVQVDEGVGPVEVEAPLDDDGVLGATLRRRCARQEARRARQGPPARLGPSPSPGVLRVLVDVRAPANEEVVVRGAEPGAGLRVAVSGGLPLRVPSTATGTLAVDVRARRCLVERPGTTPPPPFVLELAPGSEVEPVLDDGLAARVAALRRAACRP